jgi:peptide/nickel transport system ATP-binding protein
MRQSRSWSVLELHDLVVCYGSGNQRLTAVDRVSLRVNAAETTGIAGESGSGKSTVARAVVGQVPIVSGTVIVDGREYNSAKSRRSPAYRRLVQLVFQDPTSSLNPRMTIGQTISEVLAQREHERQSRQRAEVSRLLKLVGLSDSAMDRFPHQFSGGQAQRIAIARALAVQPKVLLLDEVTSALDVSAQAMILNLLNELQKEFGISYVLISHDLSVVGYMSETIAVMYLGQVVEYSSSRELFERPYHPYTQGLLASIPSFGREGGRAPVRGDMPDPRKPPPGCRFNTRCPIGPKAFPERTICLEEDPSAIANDQPHRAACHYAVASISTDERATETVGEARPTAQLRVVYSDDGEREPRRVAGVSVDAEPGRRI